MASKQAEVIGEMGASVAPAIMTSAVPSRMSSTAWPRESRPEVHPVDTTAAGPSAPAALPTSAASELGTKCRYSSGTAYSWSTFHLRPPSLTTAYSRSRLVVQPTALPTAVPTRPGSRAEISRPLSARASRVETTANCAARSSLRVSCWESPAAKGSKSTSAATCERNGEGS